MLVRIIALALIGWAVAELAVYYAYCHNQKLPLEILPIVVKSLPFIAGVVILIKSKSLAEWVSDLLDN